MSGWERKKTSKEYKYDCKNYMDMIRFNKQSTRKKGNIFYGLATNPLPLYRSFRSDETSEHLLSTICNDGSV